jgi:hypothetical protein
VRAAVAVVILVSVAATPGRAEQAAMAQPTAPEAAEAPVRLLLLTPPLVFEQAVRAALAPWRVVVLVDHAPPPGDATAAEELADQHRANAVAWMKPGHMVVYDYQTDETVERPIEAPGGEPAALDDASAASRALTLKTLLRLPPEPPPAEPTVVVAVAPPPPPAWRVGVLGGVRLRGGDSEARFTITGERRLGPAAAGLWASVGGGFDVEGGGGFRGTWSDTAAGVVALLPLERGPWRLAPGVGASLHRTSLDGEFQGGGNGGEDVELPVTSTDAGLDAELGATWRWRFVGAGARLAASYLLGREELATRGNNPIEISAVELEVAVGVFATF